MSDTVRVERALLREAATLMRLDQQAWHDDFKHKGRPSRCKLQSCLASLDLIARLRAAEGGEDD